MHARPIKRLLAVAVLVSLGPAVGLAQSAAPVTCGTKVIRATGGPALLESAARSKARSVWLLRVKGSHKYGPGYAAWLRAKQPDYTCKRSGKRIVCEASAIPCKV